VAASQVRPTADRGLLEVVEEGAATRVGSRLGDAHNVEYVKLDPGEVLQALGSQKPLGRSRKLWYKIAPPSGEFRWIHRQDLGPQQSAQVSEPEPAKLQVPETTQSLAQATPAEAEIGSGVQATTHTADEIPLQKLGRETESMQTTPIPQEEENREKSGVSDSPAVESAAQESPPADKKLPASAWTVVDQVDSQDQPPPRPSPPDEQTPSARQLVALNLQLSRTVIGEMGQWQLEPLREQAEQLAQSATDPSLRAQSLALTRRIKEFETLQRRHLEISQPNSLQSASHPPSLESTFAGHGWLIPVITSRSDLPRFALTDDKGQILHFVSSQPGLNLRRYVRKKVGIVGTPGGTSATNRPHLVASRVVLLDRHTRRIR
jgi:hypothetical protein